MPYINIQLLEGITNEQKAEVIKSVTDVMVNVLGKKPDSTYVVIQEISTNNWGSGGETVTALYQRRAEAAAENQLKGEHHDADQ